MRLAKVLAALALLERLAVTTPERACMTRSCSHRAVLSLTWRVWIAQGACHHV